MNFSEAMFYKNYLTSDFHTNIKACLPTRQNGVKNRDKAYYIAYTQFIANGIEKLVCCCYYYLIIVIRELETLRKLR